MDPGDEVDWIRVERLMLKSFTGGGVTPEEQEFLEGAWKLDKTRYAALSRSVRRKEIEERRRMFR